MSLALSLHIPGASVESVEVGGLSGENPSFHHGFSSWHMVKHEDVSHQKCETNGDLECKTLQSYRILWDILRSMIWSNAK